MWIVLLQLPFLWDLLTTCLSETAVLILRQLPLTTALWICLHLHQILASCCFSGAALILLSEHLRTK